MSIFYIGEPYRGRKPWYQHKADCYCDACFKRKCGPNRKKNLARLKENHTDYFEYIKSPLWQWRKDKYYTRFKKQCRACGTLKYIDLHHMKYGEFGHEPDYYLVPLCRICHDEYHAIYKDRNCIQNTKAFIEIKQQNILKIKTISKEFDKKN